MWKTLIPLLSVAEAINTTKLEIDDEQKMDYIALIPEILY